MMTRLNRSAGLLAVALALANPLVSRPIDAQSLAQRIASAPDGRVQFSYASREGACGDGRTFMRVNISGTTNEIYGTWTDGAGSQPCARGPVRVVLEQAARTVVGLRVFVGPPAATENVTDLGTVRTREAAEYLLSLAARAEGSVARDAIMPAMLADSVDNQVALLAIARDQTRSREARRTAISWLGRSATPQSGMSQSLLAIATNENDNQSVRQQALGSLARLEGGAGIPEVIRLAGDRNGGWMAREALTALSRSGDPRAREFLRQVVRRTELPDDALATAIRSLGQQFATAADIQLIRDAWPRLAGPKAQSAAIQAITAFGGAENADWLLALARDPAISQSTRQNALRNAVRGGVKVSALIAMYNATVDYQMKDALITALGESGDREAIDRLLVIARSDDHVSARRKAITTLARSGDPRVRKELEAIAEKR